MKRFSKIRQWIQKEKNYLWIVILLVLIHSMFSLLGTFTAPPKHKMPQKEEVLLQEERLLTLLEENETLRLFFGIGTILVLALLILGLSLAIHFLNQRRQGKRIIPWRPPDQEILWTVRDVFHVVVLIAFFSTLIEFLQLPFHPIFPGGIPENVRLLGGTLLTELAALYLIFHLVMFQKKQPLSHLGLSTSAFYRNLFFGFKSYLSLLPILLFSLFLSLWMAEQFHVTPEPQPVHHLFQRGTPYAIVFFALLLVLLMGPVVEEIFFRGFLYNAFKVKWGKRWAILFSGFCFAVLHANLVGLLPIALLGCLLAYVYELTGTLVASVTIHVLHNCLVIAVFFFATHFSQLFGTP